ncbi:hypothetical protein ABIC83_002445 [Roseateles asaccharophilus]|uniref:hypothetical protein n=1 Tax=Roseateles asaccharophilus TaxID=582607 RepID=UPI003835C61A
MQTEHYPFTKKKIAQERRAAVVRFLVVLAAAVAGFAGSHALGMMPGPDSTTPMVDALLAAILPTVLGIAVLLFTKPPTRVN